MGFIFNFIKRIIKLAIKLSIYLAIFVALIVLIPNLPPYTKFTSIKLAPIQSRAGPLAPNDALNHAEQGFKGKLTGPEAFQVFNGDLYTGLATGEIVKISPGGHITFVTKIGQPCTGLYREHICGRPLGFEIDEASKTLYVADAYYGIWKVDLKTDKKQLLVSPRVEIGKRTPKIFNAIALDKNGDFYWTDSSSDFHLKDGAFGILTDPSGRVFHYNAAKNESKVLVDDLWFANGVALSPNKEFLVISETGRGRLVKHYLAGPKKGKTEVLIDGLPGTPDNIRVLPDGSGILVGLYTVFDDDHPLLTRSMAETPVVRKFLARLQRLIEVPFEYLNTVFPNIIFEEIVYHIGNFRSVAALVPPMSGLLQADWNGNIVATYFNTDKTIPQISEGIVYNDKLFTGSPHQDFIGVVPVPPLLRKAYETVKKVEAPKVETRPPPPKPVEQAKPKVEEKPKVAPAPKVEVKPKVEQKPPVEQKPKVEPKPPVEQKPKVEEKPKVEQKPKVETKPKVEEKKDVPKVAVKPQQPPPQAKPAEAAKPVDKKPAVETPTAPKTTPPPPKPAAPATPPKPAAPATPPKPAPPATPPKPEVAKKVETATQKPEVKPAQPPKPAAEKPTPQPAASKPEQVKQATPQIKVKEQIPIKEEIPSDTPLPAKEPLKVIKKGGVQTEIPVPNV